MHKVSATISRFQIDPDIQEMMIEALLSEAVNRGADRFDLARLSFQYEREEREALPLIPTSSRNAFGLDTRLKIDDEFFRAARIDYAINMHRDRVSGEFTALKPFVRDAFRFGNRSDPLDYYYKIRGVYYQNGYLSPAESIFSEIQPYTFLGHPVIGGLHQYFIEQLINVERTLNSWTPDGARRVGQKISRIGGFVPRFIAPRQGLETHPTLSNHAFGLAIDIDSDTNPHIKDRDVIQALFAITGFDFGKPFVPSEKGVSNVDQTVQTWMLEKTASERLQAWLQTYLPILDSIEKTGSPPPRPGDPDNQCLPLDEAASMEIDRLRILKKFHGEEVRTWSTYGIQTMPLYLVVAMVKNGVDWGGMYRTSKDFMHFEIQAKQWLSPASARPLKEMFDSAHAAAQRTKIGKEAAGIGRGSGSFG
jgi:hypothetical protein